jgi:hypothetical protein
MLGEVSGELVSELLYELPTAIDLVCDHTTEEYT